jgi:hypothetical protein
MDQELLNLEFHVSTLFKILTTIFSQVLCIKTLKFSQFSHDVGFKFKLM